MLETNLKYEPEEQVGPFDDKKQKIRKKILSKLEKPSRFSYNYKNFPYKAEVQNQVWLIDF
jgi:hypothetical protein